MAEPARQTGPYDNDASGQPVTRPDLRSQEGIGHNTAGGRSGGATSGTGSRAGGASSGTGSGGGGATSGTGGDTPSQYDNGLKGAEEGAGDDDDNQVGKGYTPGKNSNSTGKGKARFRITRKQKAIGVGATGLVSVAFTFFSIASGPFEFIHFAQLLEQFHFTSLSDESDDRLEELIRYAHYAPQGEAYRTNLNYLGNKLADKFETGLNEQGLESAYTKLFGYKSGYVIDENNDNFKGKTDDEIIQQLREQFGNDKLKFSTITDADGNDHLFMEQPSGYFASKGIVRVTLKNSNYNSVTASIGARLMGERDGITPIWHPLKKLDGKLFKTLDDKYAEWRKQQTAEVEDGAEPTLTTSDDAASGNDPAETAAQNGATADQGAADSANTESQAVAQKVDTGDDPKGTAVSGLTDSLTFKLSAGGASAAGVLCLAQGIAKDAGNIKETSVILPAARIGMQVISTGSQVQSGQDIDSSQLGLDSQQFFDKANGTTWFDADSIQGELGQPQQNTSATRPSKVLMTAGEGSPLDFLLTGTVGSILSPVCSTGGQIAQGVIGFLGGPFAFAGSTIIGMIGGPPAINAISHYLAGEAIDPFPSGSDKGNTANYGALFAANDQAVSDGGRALSSSEVTALDDSNNADAQSQFDSHSFAYRVFNPDDRMSLVSTLMDRQPGGLFADLDNAAFAVLNAGLAVLNAGHLFGTIFSGTFAGLAHASPPTPYNYGPGISVDGFSADEMSDTSVENPYANGDAVATILDKNGQDGEPDYISRAEQCFGDTLAQTADGAGDQVWDVQYGTTAINTYSVQYKSIASSCNDTSDENWIRIRFFIFDTQTMKAVACYEGDEQSCQELGLGDGSSASNPPAVTTNPTPGNAEQFAQAILNNKNIDLSYSPSVSQDVQDAAAGHPGTAGAMTSSYLLQLIETIGQSHTVAITAIQSDGQGHCNGEPKSACPDDPHYNGDAVDFGSLDGVEITGRNAPAITIMKQAFSILPKGSGFGQNECGSQYSSNSELPNGDITFNDTCNHLHVQVPKGTP